MLCCFSHSDKVITLNLPSATTLLIMCVSVFYNIKNRYKAIGHPCFTPLSTLKLLLGLPFKLIAADAFRKAI